MKQSNHSCGGLYRRKLHLLFVVRCTSGSVYAVAEYLGVQFKKQINQSDYFKALLS